MEDIEQLKESIRRVTAVGSKVTGPDAAREKHRSGKKGPRVFAEEESEAMIEESFSVGGSEIDDEQMTQNQQSDDENVIDSSGKQKLADI